MFSSFLPLLPFLPVRDRAIRKSQIMADVGIARIFFYFTLLAIVL